MMKIYLLFYFFCFQFISAQFTIDYRVYHRIDSLALKDAVAPYDTKLYIDGDNTLYATDARIQADSLSLRIRKTMDFSVLVASKKKGYKSEYITADLKNKIITQYIRIERAGFKFESNINTNWLLGEESKKIGPYFARKATGELSGRHYTVWYTTEIPIPAGPFKFFGLPGLVLEAEDDSGDVRFELVSVKKIDKNIKEVVTANTNEKNIDTYEEFLKVFKAAMHSRPSKDLYDFADQESKKRLEENYELKLKKNNNFIER